MKLPPGQRRVDGFPRFGTHLHHRPPSIPAAPAIQIAGAVTEPVSVPLRDLGSLPRHETTADLHCVAGWSATGLRWEGVGFGDFYRALIEPRLQPGAPITHVVFGGHDGFRSVLLIEDALADDVLIAEHLDGRPLDLDHGAPVRLVSPSQYGFMSTKHLCRIEVHTTDPGFDYGVTAMSRIGLRALGFKHHPRSRVWREERHRHLPGWLARRMYRPLIAPIAFLSARGGVAPRTDDDP